MAFYSMTSCLVDTPDCRYIDGVNEAAADIQDMWDNFVDADSPEFAAACETLIARRSQNLQQFLHEKARNPPGPIRNQVRDRLNLLHGYISNLGYGRLGDDVYDAIIAELDAIDQL
ncbi:unnamed protein product [Vitrella brassicaformis CCMP3155]|uniref:Uncharacterized protein n=1 Tax=Vitrella brassicaformis (strain CCMP3155) TaxID=1169540 RepID=A0A0G4H363_VITBC|nr:unnamed protein product [Vitrella brassicaformis CCMP3155]|eukprot:CEM38141.1 unnamed protein product [Vitrella brassicaformis CCMP3155]